MAPIDRVSDNKARHHPQALEDGADPRLVLSLEEAELISRAYSGEPKAIDDVHELICRLEAAVDDGNHCGHPYPVVRECGG